MDISASEPFTWTAEREARLKVMWIAGSSGGEIAAEIGCPSRSAAISKAHRLGLSGRLERESAKPKRPKAQRRAPFQHPSDHSVQRPRIGADSRMTMAFDVPSGALTDLPADESPDAVTFLSRTSGCRWPLNDVSPIEAHMVCGAKCGSEDSYCSRHFLISINSNRAQTLQLSEAERARRAAQGRANRKSHQERLAAS